MVRKAVFSQFAQNSFPKNRFRWDPESVSAYRHSSQSAILHTAGGLPG